MRENKQMIVHQQYRKRARSTKGCRDRLKTPGRSRLLAVKIRTYDSLDAEKRTARLCAEQGWRQASSSTKNEVEAVVAAKGGTYALNIYQVYTYMYIKIMIFAVRGAREEAGTVGDETKSKRYQWFTYVRDIDTPTCIHTGMYFFFSLFAEKGRKQASPATKNEGLSGSGYKSGYVRT